MRLALMADSENLAALYSEAASYAETVGHIDWENPFPIRIVKELIQDEELFCSNGEDGLINASVRLSQRGDKRIWQISDEDSYLYVNKLATANNVHGSGYTESVILPNIIKRATQSRSRGIRLDCLADNQRLIRFYLRIGFTALGVTSLYSDKQQRMISVMRFEKPI